MALRGYFSSPAAKVCDQISEAQKSLAPIYLYRHYRSNEEKEDSLAKKIQRGQYHLSWYEGQTWIDYAEERPGSKLEINMADKEEFDFEEIHFLPIPSQTNIYGLTKIDGNDEERKLFLASLSGRVVCLEYPRNSPVPTSKEVPFTYIPGL